MDSISKLKNNPQFNEEHMYEGFGLELNDNAIPIYFNATDGTNRLGAIRTYSEGTLMSLSTNFTSIKNTMCIRPRVRNPYIFLQQEYIGEIEVPTSYFNCIDKSAENLFKSAYLGDICRLVYDRFDGREFEGYILETETITEDRFTVKITESKITWNSPDNISKFYEADMFNKNQIYGIVSIYKNNELLVQGALNKYTEEYTRDNDKISTIINFRAYGEHDGNLLEIEYDFLGNSRFHIRELKLNSDGESFETIANNSYYTNNDYKEGHPMSASENEYISFLNFD